MCERFPGTYGSRPVCLILVMFVIGFSGCAAGVDGSLDGSIGAGRLTDQTDQTDVVNLNSTARSGRDYNSGSVGRAVWHESLEQAQQQAAETGKPILAAFTGSDWCPPCISLHENVFESREFKSWAADNVVLLEVDFPKRSRQSQTLSDQNEGLALRYGVRSYPTVLFINSRGDVLGKQGSGNNASQWIRAADGKIHGNPRRVALGS